MDRCFRIPFAVVPALLCAAFIAACAVDAADAAGDSWGTRLSRDRMESLSDVNTGRPTRTGALQTSLVARREHGKAAIELHADAATAARLAADTTSYAPELDKALDWLQRLRPPGQPGATIILTLIDTRHRTTLRRFHATDIATVVDVVVPLPDAPAVVSVGVGKAMATALHEMRHALSARATGAPRPGRRDDEYQASLVESCYLVDTIRAGDTLRLVPRQRAGAGEYFVTAQSRNAARDAVAHLVRASGTPTVRWYDHTALLGLKLACGTSLPGDNASSAPASGSAPKRR